MTLRRALALVVVPALLIPSAIAKKKEEPREKTVEKAAKDERRYEKIKEFSVNLYDNDSDFRDKVDDAFNDMLMLHSKFAFDTNVNSNSQVVSVHEDRFRQHHQLYDNLMIQDYINRLGQRLVPPDSDKLFAFRLKPVPYPYAETLATGTIYISTGLVAMLDNEAQLAYVLAHEMAHVYKEDWKTRVKIQYGEVEYNAKQEKKAALWGLAGTAIGAGLGGAIGRSGEAAGWGALAGAGAGLIAGMVMNPTIHSKWDKVQEDEADRMAFKAILDANYDVKEVPNLYLAIQNATNRDSRVAVGFLGNRRRVRERLENAKDLIDKAYKADIQAKQQQGQLVGDNPKFRNLMAELKRDNGILAYHFDMFDVARNNLSEAVSIRSNDPAALYYYGKVMKLVGRTPEDQKIADQAFIDAAKYDFRGQNFGAHLHRALAMLSNTGANKELVAQELQEYVNNYLRYAVNDARGSRLLPPNLDTIYDYMTLLGDAKWEAKLPDDTPMFFETRGNKATPMLTPDELNPVPTVVPTAQPPGQQPAKGRLPKIPGIRK